jgi:hypothetical protein
MKFSMEDYFQTFDLRTFRDKVIVKLDFNDPLYKSSLNLKIPNKIGDRIMNKHYSNNKLLDLEKKIHNSLLKNNKFVIPTTYRVDKSLMTINLRLFFQIRSFVTVTLKTINDELIIIHI